MFKKILMATVAVGALALNAPAALADEPTYGCNFRAFQQDDATGQNFEGAAVGYVVHAGDPTATIRCYITVNGTEADSTAAGVGVTADRLTFAAEDTDVVKFYAEATTSHGTYTHEYETQVTQIPPQEVIDLIDSIVIQFVDPTLCTVLAALQGDYAGLIVINSQGDVYVAGEPQWDCPPYDIWPPA